MTPLRLYRPPAVARRGPPAIPGPVGVLFRVYRLRLLAAAARREREHRRNER